MSPTRFGVDSIFGFIPRVRWTRGYSRDEPSGLWMRDVGKVPNAASQDIPRKIVRFGNGRQGGEEAQRRWRWKYF
jgi:hypothetical protein